MLDDSKSHFAQVQKLADGVLQQSGVVGQQEIRQHVNTTRDKINDCVRLAAQLASELETGLTVWNDVDMSCEQLMKWLKVTESQLHSSALKSTLEQKRNQLGQLLVILACYLNTNALSSIYISRRHISVIQFIVVIIFTVAYCKHNS